MGCVNAKVNSLKLGEIDKSSPSYRYRSQFKQIMSFCSHVETFEKSYLSTNMQPSTGADTIYYRTQPYKNI